ncbi:MAG: alpha/beta hydrolase fold protein [Sediminibacterium sp.]|nr:alpha/beta hydrolase fold protein [Sediminibacterium sp.]
MKTDHLLFRSSHIHYTRYGHGPDLVFCFHGYGEDARSFAVLEEILGERFTLIAIDFPFHGSTDWQEGLLFEPSDMLSIIDILNPSRQQMHFLGYSMGGRVALQLLQLIPQQVSKVVLIATDGLHKNKWQWLATRTKIGNRLFAFSMKHPFIMNGLLDLLSRLGIYNNSLLKFIHYYLDDVEQRMILYRRWTTMRMFRPRLSVLKNIIQKNKIPVKMLFGKYDRVILAKHGHHFSKNAGDLVTVTEIEAGHQLLREKHIQLIADLLK